MSTLDETVRLPAPVEQTAPGLAEDRPWRRAARAALITWGAALITYALITLFAWRLVKTPTPSLHDIFARFWWQDVTYYAGIVEQGYHLNPWAPAFYPLYPMVSWVVDQVAPGGAMIACALVAVACAFVALMLLFRLAELEFGPEVANRALIYFAAFPTAFYLYNAYNASMFVMLSLGALYLCRRGHWWAAGALAGLAGTTRLFGVLLAVPLAYEYLRQRHWRLKWDALSFGLIPLGLLAYAFYCHVALGNWHVFLDAQDNWQRAYGFPGQSLFEALKVIVVQGPRSSEFVPTEWFMITAFEAAVVLGALVLTVLGFAGRWKFRRDQWFLLIATAVPLVLITMTMAGENRWLMSSPRFALEWLAPFLVLARMGRSQAVDRIYLMLAFSLQAIMFATVALQANWVA